MKKRFKRIMVVGLTTMMIMTSYAGSLAYAADREFSDVGASHWAHPYISEMTSDNVIAGDSSGLFSPNNMVSTQEAVVMAVKLLGLEKEALTFTPSPDLLLLADDSTARFISLALNRGLIPNTEEIAANKGATREWVQN